LWKSRMVSSKSNKTVVIMSFPLMLTYKNTLFS
jgi:hypothetical protein